MHLSFFYSLDSVAYAVRDVRDAGVGDGGPMASTGGLVLHEVGLQAVAGRHVPKVERYFLTRDLGDDAGVTAGNLFLFYFDESDNLLGGAGRPYYSSTSGPTVVVADSVFLKLEKKGDGGLSFADTAGADWTYRFDDFPRRDHVGTVAEPSGTREYRAFRR